MIGEADVAVYRAQGYLVVPDVLSIADVARLRAVTDALVAASAAITEHTDLYDLDDLHSPKAPRVRRLKTPHLADPVFADMVRHPGIVAILEALWGRGVRFDTSKLNMKSAGHGAPVEWHQDWAFYPHTNDDLAAVGIMLDDCGEENGPLLVVPGSHLGPIHDHHADGRFCGAMDASSCGVDFSAAVPLTGRAGTVTIHHARLIHGSAANRSDRARRLLLHQYCAADAWPLLGTADFAAWQDKLITGENSVVPRVEPVPVRLPLPPAVHQGSIYENQRGSRAAYFEPARAAPHR